MTENKYAVLNFAYGNGPYLMTIKLALAFNDELAKAGRERLGIIVPWVYGDHQKKLIAEDGLLSDEVILDAELGVILGKVFYGNTDYKTYLGKWITNFKEASREANAYLSKKYGSDIVVELNRSPRLLYGVAPAYSTSFGYLSQIFNKAAGVLSIDIPADLLKKAEEIAKCIEREQQVHAIAYPGVFSYEKDYQLVYKNEVLVPPIGPMPEGEKIPPAFSGLPLQKGEKNSPNPPPSKGGRGIYVTKTGIPGLERLYTQAANLGLTIYDNSEYSPSLITRPEILLHFARSGWASVWRSMLSEKPIVTPEYDSVDDPEIYFNNLAIEAMGIGVVYRGEPLRDVLERQDKAKVACHGINEAIKTKWGTLDGTRYSAQIFVKNFLKQ